MARAMRWRSCGSTWKRYGGFEYFLDIKNQTKTRAFNPFLRAKSDKLKNLIEDVQTQIEGYEDDYKLRKRARRAADQVTFERMIEALVSDLCLVAPMRAVHLPMSNKILRKASR